MAFERSFSVCYAVYPRGLTTTLEVLLGQVEKFLRTHVEYMVEARATVTEEHRSFSRYPRFKKKMSKTFHHAYRIAVNLGF